MSNIKVRIKNLEANIRKANWQPVAIGTFDEDGNFRFCNNPEKLYSPKEFEAYKIKHSVEVIFIMDFDRKDFVDDEIFEEGELEAILAEDDDFKEVINSD